MLQFKCCMQCLLLQASFCVLGPHCIHTVHLHRCGLLLHVARSLLYVGHSRHRWAVQNGWTDGKQTCMGPEALYYIGGEGSRFTHRKENFWRRYMCWLVVASAGSITLTADIEGWTQTFNMQFEIEHEYVVQLALMCKVHRNYAGLNDNPTELACYVIDREFPVQVDC